MGLVVVKGVVLFGYRLLSIKSWIIKYLYGVKIIFVFDLMVYDFKKWCIIDGVDWCKNVFSFFMKLGILVEINYEVEKKY